VTGCKGTVLNPELPWQAVDAMDCAILRGLMRNHAIDLQGLDPRRSVAEIAEYAGVSRNAAATRLDSWTTSGFLARTSVFPNPDLFGLAFSGRFFQGRGAAGLPAAEDRLQASGVALVYEAGAISFGDTLVGGIWPAGAAPPSAEAPGSDVPSPDLRPISGPFPVQFPASRVEIRPVDWSIVRECRAHSTVSGPANAERVGMSARNFLRRVGALLDGNGLFFLPHLDFTRARGTVLLLTVVSRKGPPTESVRGAVTERFPERLPVQPIAMSEHLFPRGEGAPELDSTEFMLPVRTAQIGLTIAQEIRTFAGVLDLIVSFPIRNYEDPGAFDALLRGRALVDGTARKSAHGTHAPDRLRDPKPR
jgi:hypothetical protein